MYGTYICLSVLTTIIISIVQHMHSFQSWLPYNYVHSTCTHFSLDYHRIMCPAHALISVLIVYHVHILGLGDSLSYHRLCMCCCLSFRALHVTFCIALILPMQLFGYNLAEHFQSVSSVLMAPTSYSHHYRSAYHLCMPSSCPPVETFQFTCQLVNGLQ